MTDMKKVHDFAVKWHEKFCDIKINYLELVDHYMADDCEALEFEMDCGNAFSERYGQASGDFEELEKIINEVNDITLLGSAIYSQWRYFNHWAYSGTEILEPKNRSWFILALNRLAMITGEDAFAFKGIPQKIRIVSNSICYGPCPKPKDIVEQHITINSDGRVWISEYEFGEAIDKYKMVKSQNFKIDKDVAENVLNKVSGYFSNDYKEFFATDVGNWQLEIKNTEGKSYKFTGSLCAEFEFDCIDLSELIREALGIYDLYVFDGRFMPDIIKRVRIDYYRLRKIREDNHIGQKDRYDKFGCKERLVIDRETESIEHIQDFGAENYISHNYKLKGDVSKLLDDFEAEYLFEWIDENSLEYVDKENKINEYLITVDYKKGPQLKLKGNFDKKGLPDDFGYFAEKVVNFMRSYGLGEILNPSIYGKSIRCPNDYIFCSVVFNEGNRSYYYLSDDDSIEVGDFVLVPVGSESHSVMVEVVNVEYFSKEEAPLNLEKIKHIIRKCVVNG